MFNYDFLDSRYLEYYLKGVIIRPGTKFVDRKKNIYEVAEIYIDGVLLKDDFGNEYFLRMDVGVYKFAIFASLI